MQTIQKRSTSELQHAANVSASNAFACIDEARKVAVKRDRARSADAIRQHTADVHRWVKQARRCNHHALTLRRQIADR